MQPVTGTSATKSASGPSRSATLANVRKIAALKVTALKRESATLRAAFQNAIQLLKVSNSDLVAIREEAINVEGKCRAANALLIASNEKLDSSNQELLTIKRQIRELVEQSGTASDNSLVVAYVDLRPLFPSWLEAAPTSIVRVPEKRWDANRLSAWRENAARRIAHLTVRQREIMLLVVKGCPSKIIAADLHISQRTVESHRASIMKKTGSKSLPALAQLALFASANGADELLEVVQPRSASSTSYQ